MFILVSIMFIYFVVMISLLFTISFYRGLKGYVGLPFLGEWHTERDLNFYAKIWPFIPLWVMLICFNMFLDVIIEILETFKNKMFEIPFNIGHYFRKKRVNKNE